MGAIDEFWAAVDEYEKDKREFFAALDALKVTMKDVNGDVIVSVDTQRKITGFGIKAGAIQRLGVTKLTELINQLLQAAMSRLDQQEQEILSGKNKLKE